MPKLKLWSLIIFLFLVAVIQVSGAEKSVSKEKKEISWARLNSKMGWSLEYPATWDVSALCTGAATCETVNADHVTIEAPKGCEKQGKEGCGSVDISTDGKFDLSTEERQDDFKISGFPAFETVTEKMVTLEVKSRHTFFLINWNGSINSVYTHIKKSLVLIDIKK